MNQETDRELLELAAKAALISIESHIGLRYDYFADAISGKEWNPLTDDGDAFRLAVKLQLLVNIDATDSQVTDGKGVDVCEVRQASNACAATRRAIVRAAAEIGRSMP